MTLCYLPHCKKAWRAYCFLALVRTNVLHPSDGCKMSSLLFCAFLLFICCFISNASQLLLLCCLYFISLTCSDTSFSTCFSVVPSLLVTCFSQNPLVLLNCFFFASLQLLLLLLNLLLHQLLQLRLHFLLLVHSADRTMRLPTNGQSCCTTRHLQLLVSRLVPPALSFKQLSNTLQQMDNDSQQRYQNSRLNRTSSAAS